MKHTLSVLAAAALLAAPAFAASPPDSQAQFAQLERDIPSLYLLNGMSLSADQYDQLAALVASNWELESSILKKTATLAAQATNAIERNVRRVAAGDKPGTRPFELRSITDLTPKQVNDDLQALQTDAEAQRDKLAAKALALLTHSQLTALEQFAPCFIPSGDVAAPLRTGRAKDSNGPEEKPLANNAQRYLLNPGCLDVIQARGLKGRMTATRSIGGFQPDQRLRSAQLRMQAATLLSGLDLTKGQTESLLPILRSAAKARGEAEKSALAAAHQTLPAMSRLRTELAAQSPTKATEDATRQAYRRVKQAEQIGVTGALQTYEKQMKAVLSQKQIALLMKQAGEKARAKDRPINPTSRVLFSDEAVGVLEMMAEKAK